MRTNWCTAERAPSNRVFADRDMASQGGVVAEDCVISELTIMSHVATNHQKIMRPHSCYHASAFFPGLIVTCSRIVVRSPTTRLLFSPRYFMSCGMWPREAKGNT
jgi:hypothetical protein